jgi:xanthine dehydrogenase small subunit
MIRQGATMVNSPTVWLPDELEEAWQLKKQLGSEACYIAGGTLIQIDWGKGLAYPTHLIIF